MKMTTGLKVGLAAWLALVVGGTLALGYAHQLPGEAAVSPAEPPAPSHIATRDFRLIMFVHPHCPCSRSSLRELARLMPLCMERVESTVYFVRSNAQSNDWVQGPLWQLATEIPGVQVEIDPGGVEAERLTSKTSGNVFLYDARGTLRFHGGLTASRGHEGDSHGRSSILSIVRREIGPNENDQNEVVTSPVYGCLLRQ